MAQRRSFTTPRAINASCISVNPVLTLQLWKNFLIRNSTNMKMIRNLITVSGTLWIEQYWQLYSHLQKIQRDFDWCYSWFKKTFLYCKAKNEQFLIRTKSKATTAVKDTAIYIPLLYTTWDEMAASNMIHCVYFWWQQPLHKLFVSSSNNACLLS